MLPTFMDMDDYSTITWHGFPFFYGVLSFFSRVVYLLDEMDFPAIFYRNLKNFLL